VKKFRVGTSGFNCNWGLLTPMVDVAGFLALLLVLSVGFYFCLLCSWNSLMDGGAVIVVLAVSLVAVISLSTDVKSCSTSVYTLYRALYSCFLLRN
jgi:hypothetical protein